MWVSLPSKRLFYSLQSDKLYIYSWTAQLIKKTVKGFKNIAEWQNDHRYKKIPWGLGVARGVVTAWQGVALIGHLWPSCSSALNKCLNKVSFVLTAIPF